MSAHLDISHKRALLLLLLVVLMMLLLLDLMALLLSSCKQLGRLSMLLLLPEKVGSHHLSALCRVGAYGLQLLGSLSQL